MNNTKKYTRIPAKDFTETFFVNETNYFRFDIYLDSNCNVCLWPAFSKTRVPKSYYKAYALTIEQLQEIISRIPKEASHAHISMHQESINSNSMPTLNVSWMMPATDEDKKAQMEEWLLRKKRYEEAMKKYEIEVLEELINHHTLKIEELKNTLELKLNKQNNDRKI